MEGVTGCSQFEVGGVSLRPGVGKLESTHFSIIKSFSDMKIKLDMQSLYIWISCCATPPDLTFILLLHQDVRQFTTTRNLL